MHVTELTVLSSSPTPPFTPDEHETVNEEKRLAHRYLAGLPGNLPSVTGARHLVPLGALYRGRTGVTAL